MCGVIDCNEWKTEKHHECTNVGESRTSRIMVAALCDVTSGVGCTKFQDTSFLLDRVYTLHYY